MARYMGPNDRLFRAVITFRFKDGSALTSIHGPFGAKAPAARQVTIERSALARRERYGWGRNSPYTLETRIESSDPEWNEVA